MFKRMSAALAAFAIPLALHAAEATFPSKPVVMVVPFAAGGPTDTVARNLAQSMSKALGQQVVIENTVGAGGTVGAAKVARAKPDGHTILLYHIGMSTAPALYRKLPFNPLTDFAYIGEVADVPMVLIGRKDLPPKDFNELVSYIKANKAKLNYANAGLGAASHLCGLLLMSTLGADVQTVPFQGTAPALAALMGGQIDFMCDQTTNTTGQIQSGAVKAYGVTSEKRVPSLPDVPTLQEQGLKGFEVNVWNALYAPKGTPKAAVDKLNEALRTALQDPSYQKALEKLGATPASKERATPEGLQQHLKSEIDRWDRIIKKAGVYAD